MADFNYEVTEEIGVIGTPTPSGWTTQLNLVSWNGKEPKLDIRSWNPDHSRMGKGISISTIRTPTLTRGIKLTTVSSQATKQNLLRNFKINMALPTVFSLGNTG